MTKLSKKTQKAINERVNRLAIKAVVGYQIPIMELPKIFSAGVAVAKTDATDEEITAALKTAIANVGTPSI